MLGCQDQDKDPHLSGVLHLLGDSTGSTPCQPVLRPASGSLRIAHHAVFDPRKAEGGRAAVDYQSPGRADRDGPNHPWTKHSAATARGPHRGDSRDNRSPEQGTLPYGRRVKAAKGGLDLLGEGSGWIRRRLRHRQGLEVAGADASSDVNRPCCGGHQTLSKTSVPRCHA